jgi:hypothetical protein
VDPRALCEEKLFDFPRRHALPVIAHAKRFLVARDNSALFAVGQGSSAGEEVQKAWQNLETWMRPFQYDSEGFGERGPIDGYSRVEALIGYLDACFKQSSRWVSLHGVHSILNFLQAQSSWVSRG